MKLRIKGNSIRLRLTQAEVEEVGKGNTVIEVVSFGSSSPTFHYAITPDENKPLMSAQYNDHTLYIAVPQSQAKEWADSNRVGIERDIPIGGDQSLHVLIEKDFQCLHQRPREDERDNFPNPKANQA